MNRTQEKAHMEALATKLKTRVTLDSARAWHIAGRRGNVHPDAQGYSLYLERVQENSLDRAKTLGLVVRQRGDEEAVLHVPNFRAKGVLGWVRGRLGV